VKTDASWFARAASHAAGENSTRILLALSLCLVACGAPAIPVVVNGTSTQWTMKQLRTVPKVHSRGFRGHAQESWRLADVVHALIGPNARAVAVVDDDDKRHEIRDAEWFDLKKVLVLALGQKDFFKVERLYPDGSYEEPIAKGVQQIEVTKEATPSNAAVIHQ
jgi:hypothetical protein